MPPNINSIATLNMHGVDYIYIYIYIYIYVNIYIYIIYIIYLNISIGMCRRKTITLLRNAYSRENSESL